MFSNTVLSIFSKTSGPDAASNVKGDSPYISGSIGPGGGGRSGFGISSEYVIILTSGGNLICEYGDFDCCGGSDIFGATTEEDEAGGKYSTRFSVTFGSHNDLSR